MLSFTRPSIDLTKERRLNARWIGSPDAVRARRRYRFDHASAVVGKGAEDFERARSAVGGWAMARQGWIDVHLEADSVTRGSQVAAVARVGPIWNVSYGIVTQVDDGPRRYAFSYGTTKDHAAKGEERFEVVHHDNNDVVFSISAVSRPARWWGWLGYPIMRWTQARFRRGAIKAVRDAVAG